MDTFNLYMDEITEDLDGDAEAAMDVQFRLVPAADDTGNPERDAVLADLDVYDLIDLRDTIQGMIDLVAVAALDPGALDELDELADDR